MPRHGAVLGSPAHQRVALPVEAQDQQCTLECAKHDREALVIRGEQMCTGLAATPCAVEIGDSFVPSTRKIAMPFGETFHATLRRRGRNEENFLTLDRKPFADH